ncbi:hypothetical protein TNCV_2087991 [Trichonephila clavipes]|nr:hypothetical protein TNCV_2087991 [Trichonephila clavipes]
MYSVFRGESNSCRAASPLVNWWKGKKGGRLVTTSRTFPLRIGMESSKVVPSPVWYSKARLSTGVSPALCRDEFRAPRSDTVRQEKCNRSFWIPASMTYPTP